MEQELLTIAMLIVVFLGALFYKQLWWGVQALWIKDGERRRPFTFIMRDIGHKSPLTVIAVFFILGRYAGEYMLKPVPMVTFLFGMLLAHLFFGEKYTPDQQEYPPYNPSKDCNYKVGDYLDG